MYNKLQVGAISIAMFMVIAVQSMVPLQVSAMDADAGFFDIRPHHTGISVANLDESIAWYHKMFGFEVVSRNTQDANPKMTFALLRRGDCYIELFQVVDGKPLPEYRRDPTADLYVHGIKHFAFQVKDARAAAAALKAKGAEIAMGPVENDRVVFVFIRDNSGNAFEMIQFKDQGTPAAAGS